MLVSAVGIKRGEVPGTGTGQSLKEGTALLLGSDNPLLHGHTHTKHILEMHLKINFEILEKWQLSCYTPGKLGFYASSCA